MLLMLGAFVALSFAVVMLIRSVWRLMHSYPHISEKSIKETYQLLTDAKMMDRLMFYVNETKMTHMLFPRNMSCKGSHAELNLTRYNSVILSGDIFFLEFLLKNGGYQSGFLVSHEIGHPYEYPGGKFDQRAIVDLDAIIQNCPSQEKRFQDALRAAFDIKCETDDAGKDILSAFTNFFDNVYGISSTGDIWAQEENTSKDLLIAFRSELELLHRAQMKHKYNALLQFYVWGEDRNRYNVESIKCRLLNISNEIVELCRGSTGLFPHIIDNCNFSPEELCMSLELLSTNAGRMASTAVSFLSEVLANPMYSKGLLKDINIYIEEYGTKCLDTADIGDNLKSLKYFNDCILEVLRKWPTNADGLSFKILEDLLFDGELISKGSDIVFPFFSLFRQLWIDRPDMYMPHRWHDSHHQCDALKAVFEIVFKDDKSLHPFQSLQMAHLRILLFQLFVRFDMEIIKSGIPSGSGTTFALVGARVTMHQRSMNRDINDGM